MEPVYIVLDIYVYCILYVVYTVFICCVYYILYCIIFTHIALILNCMEGERQYTSIYHSQPKYYW
jgi:hypothetical protein